MRPRATPWPGGHRHPDYGPLPPHERRQCDAPRSHAVFKQLRYTGPTPARDIGVVGRNTEGVRPIDLLEDEHLVGMEGFEDYEQC